MKELIGAGVALITPFNTDGTIDFDTLGKLIEYQINEGINYLVILGTTGESATLTETEKNQIWKFTAEKVSGRIPLVAGIGGNSTREVVDQVKNFNINGYSSILSVSPYYNKPTQSGIYQHYKAISEVSKLPLILYNVPGRTGSNIAPGTTIKLAKDFKNIVAIKEASGNFNHFSEIMRDKPKDFSLISGDDPVTLPMIALGATGIISVIGNAYPKEVVELTKLALEGNYEKARIHHSNLLAITDLCFVESNPCGIKYVLKEKGFGQDNLRLPLIPIGNDLRNKIKIEMKKLSDN